MSALTDFLSHFDRVKPTGGQSIVPCPAHEDRKPSLAVKEADDGSILLHCHAGCSVDQVLAALGLDSSALFPSRNGNGGGPKTIAAVYDYTDEFGALLFQAVRYTPKDFRQRVSDGKGGWKYSLNGVRRVVYQLHQIKGHPAILICEGEKDVDAAWRLGLPATCNPMGAGKWSDDYSEQLKAAGVLRVAVLPDNDPPGFVHAETVAASLFKSSISVRNVKLPELPDHGDLTDFLTTHTKDELLRIVRDAELWKPGNQSRPKNEFIVLGEQRYAMSLATSGVRLEMQRLRRAKEGLTGELKAVVAGLLPTAKHYDGVVHSGDLNLSAVESRARRAIVLRDRSGERDLDWFGILEEFVTKVTEAERRGTPAINLQMVPKPRADRMFSVDGVQLPLQHPTILFGDGGSAKSYLAMYWAGKMAQLGYPVLYADWEFTPDEHRERLELLFGQDFPPIRYLSCYGSFRDERERIAAAIRSDDIKYLICDSVALACGGDPCSSEFCMTYFQALRQLGPIGSLHIAHVTKGNAANGKADDQKPFGSAFWHNMARVSYYVKGDKVNDSTLAVGLYPRKRNLRGHSSDVCYTLVFGDNQTSINPSNIRDNYVLTEGLSLSERLRATLADTSHTRKELTEILGVEYGVLQRTVWREIKSGHLVEFPGKRGQERIGLS